MAPRARIQAERQKRSQGEEQGPPVGTVLREDLLTDLVQEAEADTIPTRVRAPSAAKEEKPRKTARPESEKSSRPQSRATYAEREMASLGDKLYDKLVGLGALASAVFPVTGIYIVLNADKGINGLLDIAKRNDRVRKVLLRVADTATWGEVVTFGLGIAAGIQVDTGRLSPDSVPAKVLKVDEAYYRVAEQQGEEPGTQETEAVQSQRVTHAQYVPTGV